MVKRFTTRLLVIFCAPKAFTITTGAWMQGALSWTRPCYCLDALTKEFLLNAIEFFNFSFFLLSFFAFFPFLWYFGNPIIISSSQWLYQTSYTSLVFIFYSFIPLHVEEQIGFRLFPCIRASEFLILSYLLEYWDSVFVLFELTLGFLRKKKLYTPPFSYRWYSGHLDLT